VGFWVFVAVMLAWQAYNYNNSVVADAAAHPEKHYFYDPGAAAPPPVPKAPAPDVRQVAYHVLPGSPVPGNFTVQFTVKNLGTAAATGIRVKVRPYRGIMDGNEDNGHAHADTLVPSDSDDSGNGTVGPISENDPTSQFGQWVSIPDLAPGESSSNSVTFVDQSDKIPNDNPRLEIEFVPVKSN
jgi:hypothetical protein